MDKKDLSILVVDDTKFSSAIVSKALNKEGYSDLRAANSALDALEQIKERSIDILLADWIMPEMDGLELTKKVRELDEATGQYTYIILLTAKDGAGVLSTAFDAGVDEFIDKASMKEQLVPRFYAAERLTQRHNELIRQNRKLASAKQELEALNTIDALTKIGNVKYVEMCISDTLDHVESRGGALCFLLFNILDMPQLKKEYPEKITNELIISFSKRLRQLVRPLDGMGRISETEFGVTQHQSSIDVCDGKIFKRVLDGLTLKPYQTEAGFISIKVAASLVGVDTKVEFYPDAESVIRESRALISDSEIVGEISTIHWSSVR